MRFRRLCDHCGDLVVCSKSDADELSCCRCGGTLVGPVAFPTPDSYRERVDVLLSPHYLGAVASPPKRRRRAAASS
jgi:hypothetical protein